MVQLTNVDLSFLKPNVPTVQEEIKTGILSSVPTRQTVECPATQTAKMELDKFNLGLNWMLVAGGHLIVNSFHKLLLLKQIRCCISNSIRR